METRFISLRAVHALVQNLKSRQAILATLSSNRIAIPSVVGRSQTQCPLRSITMTMKAQQLSAPMDKLCTLVSAAGRMEPANAIYINRSSLAIHGQSRKIWDEL